MFISLYFYSFIFSVSNSCHNEVGKKILIIDYSIFETSFNYIFISGRPDKISIIFLKCGPIQVHNKKSHKAWFALWFDFT